MLKPGVVKTLLGGTPGDGRLRGLGRGERTGVIHDRNRAS